MGTDKDGEFIMQTTTNLGLKKPEANEYVDVGDLNYNADEVDKLAAPEYDDSGTVSGITSFPAFLATMVSGMGFFQFFRNLKAGLKFVLHAGQLVNNGQATEPGFALDARYGKTLYDLYAQLNANMGEKTKVVMQPFSFSITIPANGHTYVDVPITIPSGYTFGNLSVYGGGSRNVVTLSAVRVSSGVIAVSGSSTHTVELTITGNVDILFYK